MIFIHAAKIEIIFLQETYCTQSYPAYCGPNPVIADLTRNLLKQQRFLSTGLRVKPAMTLRQSLQITPF